MTALLISLGHRTGLFDLMEDGLPRTSSGLADEGGMNERYVREWLGRMVVSRIVERDPLTDQYWLPRELLMTGSPRWMPFTISRVRTRYCGGHPSGIAAGRMVPDAGYRCRQRARG